MRYGARGLELLSESVSPKEALARLVADDERPEFRQVAFLGADGQAAAHTGDACVPCAGHIDELATAYSRSTERHTTVTRMPTCTAEVGSLAWRPQRRPL